MSKNTTVNDNLWDFRGLFLFLSLLAMLSSCTSFAKKTSTAPPVKNFQYAFQAPTRTLLDSKVKLGRSYFSASGYACKKYTMKSGQQGSACKINGRWYSASPILNK